MKYTNNTIGVSLGGAFILLLVFTLASPSGAQTTCVEPPAGLVSWWPGDEDANDIVDENPGTLLNGATFAPGLVEQAFLLDGIDDFVAVEDSENLRITGDLTIDAWVNPALIVGEGAVIVTKRSLDNNDIEYTLFLDASGRLAFNSRNDGGGFADAISTQVVPTGGFSHVAVTIEGAILTLYINGAVTTVAYPFTRPATTGRLTIGIVELGIGLLVPFSGLIDEVEIYNRALSASEIEAIFDAGSAGKCKLTPVPFTAFLHGIGSTANPPTLFLDDIDPIATTAKYKDSAGIKFSGGNLWKAIGTWSADPAFSAGTLEELGTVHVWLGLKNSDDIGTRFDLRAEVYKNSTLVAGGETYCIQGVTRDPAQAREVTVSFAPFSPVDFDGTTDVLALAIRTRIGTNGAGVFCGGHSNAVGLRLYFDAVDRDSRFDGILAQ